MVQFDFYTLHLAVSIFSALYCFLIFLVLFSLALIVWLKGAIRLLFKVDLIKKNYIVAAENNFEKTAFSAVSIYFNFDLLEQFVFIASGAKMGFYAAFALLSGFLVTAFSFSKSFYYVGTFIGSLVADVAGDRTAEFSKNWVILCTLFLCVLMGNLAGLMPHAFTITSSLAGAFFFSTAIFFAYFYNILSKNGVSFFAGFLPAGTNKLIAPLIVVIELISTVAKFISLGVRLFANMFAGHLLLKAFYSVSFQVILSFSVFYFFADIFITIFLFFITSLEFMIACLQAFVMVLLAALYLNESDNFVNAH